jgi:lipopolysaccharide export system protein LptC
MAHLDASDRIERAAPATRADRSRAFRRANRHSARVRILKWTIIAASIGGVIALGAFAVFDPLGKLPAGVTVGQTTLDGSRITMELPKMSGFRSDGRSYEVRAASGVQDVRNPKVIELNELEAKVGLGGNDSATASAPKGILDSTRDFLQLRGDGASRSVRIASTTGYEIILKQADIDFRAGTAVSDDPVTVRLPNGLVSAERFSMADNGRVVTFDGNVHSEIWQEKPEAAPSAGAQQP